MKNSVILLLVLSAGCNIIEPADYRYLPDQEDLATLRGTQYISHTASEVIFKVDVVMTKAYYFATDEFLVTKENFLIGGEGSYLLESLKSEPRTPAEGSASIFLLIDQSGSYETIDPFNARSQAMSKFFEEIQAPHRLMVGAASREGALTSEPLELRGQEFGNDWQANRAFVFDLARRTGGAPAILDAASIALDKLIAAAANDRKELVVLVRDADTRSSTSVTALVSKAVGHGISIHVIVLGEGIPLAAYARLSQETGGLLALCTSDKRLVTAFGQLSRHLNGTSYVHTLQIRHRLAQGTAGPGHHSVHRIACNDSSDDGGDYNPVEVHLTIPL